MVALARPGPRKNRSAGTFSYYVVASVVALIFLFPLVWAAIRSLQGVAAEGSPPTWASLVHLTFTNYTSVLAAGGATLWRFAGNSAVVAVGTVAISVFVSVLAGYGLARLRFRGAGLVFVFLLTPFMVPYQAMMTPIFQVLSWMHLANSLLGLVLIYSVFQVPFSVYVMRNSFSTVPRALEESAMVDGASVLGVFRRVMLPLAIPGVVTVVLYSFLFGWNEFLAALMLISSNSRFTLPVALNNLELGLYGSVNLGALDAGAVIAMLPCIALFLLLQRNYVRGLTTGALKG
jgi:multiple sugar transport system permease protein